MLYYKKHVLSSKHDWVVFLHGLGGNSNIWYKQVDEFKKHFNLLFIDLHGHGGSLKHKQENLCYTAKGLSRDVIEVLDALSIEKAHFAGISLGTIILHGVHKEAPERVKSMILGGAVTHFNSLAKVLLKTGNLLKGAVPYMWLYKLFARILMPKERHKKSRDIFIREAKKLRRKEFMKWYKFVSTAPEIYAQMDTDKHIIPKIYIMGEQDYMFVGPVKKDSVKDKVASVHVIKQCGHVCNIEKHDEFNQVAIKFFKERQRADKEISLSTSRTSKRVSIAKILG